ncbi:MAG: hypothetical protein HYU98_01155, partial [Deltaproteobacteria bacterium]|nr:hypothetical protein [Deltaproteobacteria bacterium]
MSDISSIDKTNANGEFLSMSLRRVQSLPRDDEAISRIQFYAGDRFVQGTPANSHVASGPIGPFKWAGMMPQLAMSAMPPSDERGFELQYASIREAQGGDVGNMAMSELLNLANGLYTSVNILRSGRRCADAYTAYLLWFRVSGRINDEVERKTEAASVYASDSRMEDLSSQASVLRDQIHALFRKATEELLRIGRAQLEDKDKDVDARGTFERLLQFITETRGLATRPQEDEITRVSKEVQARLQLIKHENAVLEALIDPAQRRSAEAALENLSSEYKDAGMPLRAAIS